MKKVFLGTLVIALFAMASCSKSSTSGPGSWTFKGTTTNATACAAALSSVVAVNGTNSCSVSFATLPTANGTYTTTSGSPSGMAGTVTIGSYYSTGTGTMSVTVSGGKVSVSSNGNGVMLSNGSDSALATFSINQQ